MTGRADHVDEPVAEVERRPSRPARGGSPKKAITSAGVVPTTTVPGRPAISASPGDVVAVRVRVCDHQGIGPLEAGRVAAQPLRDQRARRSRAAGTPTRRRSHRCRAAGRARARRAGRGTAPPSARTWADGPGRCRASSQVTSAAVMPQFSRFAPSDGVTVNSSGWPKPCSANAPSSATRTPADRVGRHERDRRAAEAAAGHPCADRAVGLGGLDGEVELGDGDLEVVAHRAVGGVEQLADRRPVPARAASARCRARAGPR